MSEQINESHPEFTTTDAVYDNEDLEFSQDDEQEQQKEQQQIHEEVEGIVDRKVEKMRATLDAIEKMIEEENTNSPKFRNKILELTQHYYVKRKKMSLQHLVDLRTRQAEMVADSPALPALCRMAYQTFQDHKDTRFCQPDSEDLQLIKGPYNLVTYVMTLCQNFADQSEYFAKKLSTIQEILQLCRDMMIEFVSDHLDGRLHKDVDKRLRQSFSIVYNMLFKRDSEIFFVLQEYDFANLAEPYMASKEEHFKFSAYLVIVFGSTEELAKQKVVEEDGMVKFLLKHLGLAFKDKDKRSRGYDVVELAKCTHQFSLNDAHKPLLLRLGILEILQPMLDPDNADAEVEQAMLILLSLSFHPECAAAVRDRCRPELKTLRMSNRWKRHRLVDSLNFKIFDGELDDADDGDERGEAGWMDAASKPAPLPPPAASQPPQPTSAAGHVMISYHQKTSSSFVQWIHKELRKRQIEVWVDYERMQDSTLDCMAKAVEASVAILMCVSKGYKESEFCRMEAEYAVRKRKVLLPLLMEEKYHPDGWLGFIMGNQRYYDFSGRKNKAVMLRDLLAVLETKFNDVDDSAKLTTVTQVNAIPRRTAEFASWTSDRVRKWIVDNQLPSFLESFELTGRHLQFLVELQETAPEAFYRLLDTGLKLTMFHHVFDFVQAINQLHC